MILLALKCLFGVYLYNGLLVSWSWTPRSLQITWLYASQHHDNNRLHRIDANPESGGCKEKACCAIAVQCPENGMASRGRGYGAYQNPMLPVPVNS